jgi:hypothetical protein
VGLTPCAGFRFHAPRSTPENPMVTKPRLYGRWPPSRAGPGIEPGIRLPVSSESRAFWVGFTCSLTRSCTPVEGVDSIHVTHFQVTWIIAVGVHHFGECVHTHCSTEHSMSYSGRQSKHNRFQKDGRQCRRKAVRVKGGNATPSMTWSSYEARATSLRYPQHARGFCKCKAQ